MDRGVDVQTLLLGT